MKAIVQAIEKKGLSQDNTVIVSGIGCSSRASGYMDFDTLHTAHGRAIPFATGIKLANPDLNVVVITGDGRHPVRDGHQAREPRPQRRRHHRRRRLHGHRRQSLHPRLPPQRRSDRRALQQRNLRHDRRPGIADDAARQEGHDSAVRLRRPSVRRLQARAGGRCDVRRPLERSMSTTSST